MTLTHFIDWTMDDEAETDIVVEYTISGGCPVHMGDMNYPGHPAEAPEVEIVGARQLLQPKGPLPAVWGPPLTLTDAETEKVRDFILENHEDEDDPDDARERRAEQQRDDDLCDNGRPED